MAAAQPPVSPADRVLLTGAAGFIGSHVAEALLRAGASVVGLDNLDSFYAEPLKRRNLEEVAATARIAPGAFRFVEGDIRDAALLDSLMNDEGVTGVIHLAARAGVRPSIAEPALYASVNVEGTSAILDAARRCPGCTRVVVASSSSVYGNNEKIPFAETDAVEEPISPYAATKRACELVGHTFHHLYETPVAMLRFFTVFGPRQRPDLAIAKFIRLISAGEPIPMFGNGHTSRDYTYIDDIVAGVLASYARIPEHGYRVWNLGNNKPVRLDEMIRTVAEAVGREARIEQRPEQMGDVERTFADITRSRAELGYEPKTPFAEGVRRQWEWYRGAVAAGR